MEDMAAGGEGPRYDLVVVGASAGGIPALKELLSALPPDFPVPVAVVQHHAPVNPRVFPGILRRYTRLSVKTAEEGDALARGTVYLAPGDWHLIVRPDHSLGLMDGLKIRYVRSAVNPLFESAAYVLQGRVIAVVLTGGGSDATDGVQSVKGMGGVVIAQDEASSEHFSMPRTAIGTGAVDYVLPLKEIAPALVQLLATGSYHRVAG